MGHEVVHALARHVQKDEPGPTDECRFQVIGAQLGRRAGAGCWGIGDAALVWGRKLACCCPSVEHESERIMLGFYSADAGYEPA